MMNKIFLISLSTFLLLIISVSASVFGQGTTVSIGNASAIPGATFSVPITIGDNSDVFATDIILTYDSNILTVTDVTTAELTSDWYMDFNPIDGELRIGMFSLSGDPLASQGNLVDIHFQVNSTAVPGQASPLDLTEVLLNETLGQTIDGEFMVTSPLAKITLTKSADKAFVSSGEELTFTITFQNTGEGTANNVVITDTIPDGTQYVTGSATGNPTCNPSECLGQVTLTWTIASLPANGNGTVSFKVTVE